MYEYICMHLYIYKFYCGFYIQFMLLYIILKKSFIDKFLIKTLFPNAVFLVSVLLS